MEIQISHNNIRILDSWEVSKERFDGIINRLQNNLPQHPVVINRSKESIKNEWAVHNLLYKLRIARNHTHDLDINYPQTLFEEIGYNILGPISLLFIR